MLVKGDTWRRLNIKIPSYQYKDSHLYWCSAQVTNRHDIECVVHKHYNDVIMSAMASQLTSLTIVYSSVYSGADQRKHQSSASLAFVRGIRRWPVNSLHQRQVTREMFSFDDVIMCVLFRSRFKTRAIFHCQELRWNIIHIWSSSKQVSM